MNKEIWKDIPSCEGYEASNTGKIRRKAYEMKLSNCGGYLMVNPGGRGSRQPLGVHRLVLEAFVGKSDLVVNHKDGNKSNNNLENIEYTTQKENIRHARSILGKKFGFMKGHKNGKKPIMVEAFKDGVSMGKYDSILDASFNLRLGQGNISAQINGRLKETGGYTFKRII